MATTDTFISRALEPDFQIRFSPKQSKSIGITPQDASLRDPVILAQIVTAATSIPWCSFASL